MKLTPRQRGILTFIACGYTDKEISQKLKISPRTIQVHIGAIFKKLNAKNRAHAVALYIQVNPKWKFTTEGIK